MNIPAQEDVIQTLLDSRPQTLAETLGIAVDGSTASLYRLLIAALLFNRETSPVAAGRAYRLLEERRWTEDIQFLSESTLDERIEALEEADYIMFDERETYAVRLGELVNNIQFNYNGTLKNLRRKAGSMPDRERALLKEFKGIGDFEADAFLREVQSAWTEVYPFLSSAARLAARGLGLPENPIELAEKAGRDAFPRLAAALEQTAFTGSEAQVLERARRLRVPAGVP